MINFYKNLGGNSSVVAFESTPTSIRVQFKTGSWYTYSYRRAGIENVEYMKMLAEKGQGLCSFIQKNVKYLYD